MPDELFMRAKKNDPNLPRHCLEQSVISDVGSDDEAERAGSILFLTLIQVTSVT